MAKIDITRLLVNPEIADTLLENLNQIANDHNSYEYGLPIIMEDDKAQLREAVYQWLITASQEEETNGEQ